MTATVINAVRQAGAGCSRGGEHLGDSAGLSCTVFARSWLAPWSLGKAQGLECDSFKASSLLAAKSPLPVLHPLVCRSLGLWGQIDASSLTLTLQLIPGELPKTLACRNALLSWWSTKSVSKGHVPVELPRHLASSSWVSRVHQQPLHVGVGQVVFLQSEEQPVSVLCWNSFLNVQIR